MVSVGQVWSSDNNAVRDFSLFESRWFVLTKKTTLGLFNQGCGNDTNGVQLIDNSHCMMACSGDSTENCGGPDALIFYLLDG